METFNSDIKVLCRFLGGSQLYGLSTPESDKDERGLIMSTRAKFILGTGRFDESRNQDSAIQLDVVYKELGHWVRLLNAGNTEAFEMLFAPRSVFTVYEKEFELFRQNPYAFMDSKKLFNCLRGYAQSEFRLAKGERVGVLGSKRKMALEKYGYSHRNASHLVRLLNTGITFFKQGVYVVNCADFPDDIYEKILHIKTKPTEYSVEQLAIDYAELEKDIVEAYENRKKSYHFDEKEANKILLSAYYPHLSKEFAKNSLDDSSSV